MKNQIYFIFPYRGMGGVPILFVRIGEELAKRGIAKVYFVDYPDGTMANMMQKNLCTLVNYSEDGNINIPPKALMVFQSLRPWMVNRGLSIDPSARILFWNCHPFNLIPLLPGIRVLMQRNILVSKFVLNTILFPWRNRMIRLIRLMEEKKALVFMDQTNVRTTERFLSLRLNKPTLLPIPSVKLKSDQQYIIKQKSRTAPIRIIWVGRIVDFKYHILKYTLDQINSISRRINKNILVEIIGSGEFSKNLERDTLKFKDIRIKFTSDIPTANLSDYLQENCDLLLAMGTSALEGAKIGIPTLLLDIFYHKVKDGYQYQWLHDRQGYTLGDMADDLHYIKGNDDLYKRLKEVSENSEILSKKSLEYFEKNHSLESVMRKFIYIQEKSVCYWDDWQKADLVGPGTIYSIFRKVRFYFGKSSGVPTF